MIRTLILTADPITRALLEKMVTDAPELSHLATTNDTAEAALRIEEGVVDLLFQDADLDGFPVLSPNPANPLLVVISASAEFAKTALEREAAYYLQKPLSRAAFKNAVSRVTKKREQQSSGMERIADVLFVQNESGIKAIPVSDILSAVEHPGGTLLETVQGTFLVDMPLPHASAFLESKKQLR